MKRTLTAAGLVAGALAIPLSAWYLTGAAEARREAERLREEPVREARKIAERYAIQVAARLTSILEAEERRPFFHYQNLYHDPRGAYGGEAVIPSPLAEGPGDAWIGANFQIDAQGKLTLPTLNEDVPEANRAPSAHQLRLIKTLRPAAAACVALADAPGPAQTFVPIPQDAAGPKQTRERQSEVSSLDPEAWGQYKSANSVFQSLRSGKGGGKKGIPQGSSKQVEVRTDPFVWRTVEISGEPSLVALRQVDTPDGTLTQGFWVDLKAVSEWVKPDSPLRREMTEGRWDDRGEMVPCFLEPFPASGSTDAALPLPGVSWRVRTEAVPGKGELLARRAIARFRRGFLGGAAAALLSGLLVIGLVWQSERLALQRSQFAASAAHELRTPLAGLRMYAEMLAEGLGDPAKAPSYARRLAEEAERLGRVVSNVLGFSRLERGSLNVRPEPGDLGAAAAKAVDRQRPALEGAGVRLSVQLEEGLPSVRFDADAVAQIVQNLLDNAEKYGRGCPDRAVEISVRRSSSGVELSVSDRGPGIPASLRRRLFRPFARGEGTDAPAGLGLGLALVKALADAQGARVSCEDRPGGGSVFRVSFPA